MNKLKDLILKKKNYGSTFMILTLVSLLAHANSAFAKDLAVKTPATLPGKEMKMKKSGVPTYNQISRGTKNKDIPKLNIGEEATLEFKALTPEAKEAAKALKLNPLQNQVSPKIVDIKSYVSRQFSILNPAKEIIKINPLFKAPEVKDLKPVADPVITETEVTEQKVATLSTSEEKLLQSIILLDFQKSYYLALGLLAEVLGESKELKTQASFHFARAALNLGLAKEHEFYMLRILKEASKDWQKLAAQNLAMNAGEGQFELVPTLDAKIDELNIELKDADQYQINRARYYMGKNDLSNALAASEEVKELSPLISSAEFVKSVILYRSGKLDDAEPLMSKVVQRLEKNNADSELKSVAALTLARLQFQKAKYKEAFQSYLLVNKTNPLWMQAMVEQAWAQILTEDYEGAAGNMYTLHTDFFKNAFAPESYVARAVGYLNLCQFGDGAKVVYSLNHRYMPMKDMLEQFKEKNKTDADYYELVRAFFKNPQMKIINGLHRNFIYEIARNPEFLDQQKKINSAEDQMTKYNNVSLELLQLERQILQKQTDAEAKILALQKLQEKPAEKGVKVDPATYQPEIDKLKALVVNSKMQYQVAKRARSSVKDVRTAGLQRLESDKALYKNQAAHVLKTRFEEMLASLTKALDQAEVLRYELYSGAGEHLRFQLGGGEINDKDREALKVQDHKAQKWDFKGEVWEDELGHYRSSLKNVCPKDDKVSQN